MRIYAWYFIIINLKFWLKVLLFFYCIIVCINWYLWILVKFFISFFIFLAFLFYLYICFILFFLIIRRLSLWASINSIFIINFCIFYKKLEIFIWNLFYFISIKLISQIRLSINEIIFDLSSFIHCFVINILITRILLFSFFIHFWVSYIFINLFYKLFFDLLILILF